MDPIVVRAIARYVEERQLEDGGFFFAREANTPSAEDTFYAIETMLALGLKVPRMERVVNYLRGMQKADGSFPSIEVARYVIEALADMGVNYDMGRGFRSWLLSNSVHDFWLRSKSQIALELFEAATTVLRITDALKEVDVDELVRSLSSFESEEGGYGVKVATLSNTYYAVRSLWNLGLNVSGACEEFLSKCEVAGVGFSERPTTYPPVISDMYHGIWLAKATGYAIADPDGVRKFVLTFMNGNGGFRYFPEMGISTLENTYYAVESLSLLEGKDLAREKVESSLKGLQQAAHKK
ncbi:MAG: prenyltransferase/squalene oxidase repeat-containing protein [Thermoprotei archaeon]